MGVVGGGVVFGGCGRVVGRGVGVVCRGGCGGLVELGDGCSGLMVCCGVMWWGGRVGLISVESVVKWSCCGVEMLWGVVQGVVVYCSSVVDV